MNNNDETLYFRYQRDLYGRLVPVDTARWNGRLVPRFDPAWSAPEKVSDPYDSEDFRETADEVCYNLTPRQREIFLTFADTQNISETARRCGISHPAVHDFFRRMAARNEYVAIMLRRRKGQL